MLQNPNFPAAQDPAGGAYSAPPDPQLMGRGLAAPRSKNPTPLSALRASFLRVLGVKPITELLTLLVIDFKCRPICEVRIFSVSENGENGLRDEGADWAVPPPPRIFGL